MARILLWNSVATRRRSAGDTFLDNGLGVLQAHLEDAGHRVLLEDWATDPFFADLAVPALARPLRSLYRTLLSRPPGRPSLPARGLGALALGLQALQSRVQRARMAARVRDLAWRVAEQGIPVVGVKLWYGEAFGWARRLAQALAEVAPEVITVAGGYHATLYEEDVLAAAPFDLAVRGEGEFALAEVLGCVDRMAGRPKEEILREIASRRLENGLWRDGGQVVRGPRRPVRLGRKTIPRYGETPGKVRVHVIVESLGCPWGQCHFCVHPHFYERYEPRAVADVVAEMAAAVEQGIGLFRFAGSDTPPAFGARIAEGILEAGLEVVYGMGSRAVRNGADPAVYERTVAHYETLIRSGLRAVFMGGETGHDRINREVMNKGVTRADLVATARAVREAEARAGQRVDLILALIHPVPLVEGVTQQEVFEADLELLREFAPDSVMVTPPGPFKHSRWHAEKERFGFELAEDFIASAMEYEYVLYKPPSLWPPLDLRLQGRPFVELLEECSRLRKAAETLGIPTDLSDEHFLLMRAAGYEGRDGAQAFKRETLLDVVSCDYRGLAAIAGRVNRTSRELAAGRSAARESGSRPV